MSSSVFVSTVHTWCTHIHTDMRGEHTHTQTNTHTPESKENTMKVAGGPSGEKGHSWKSK